MRLIHPFTHTFTHQRRLAAMQGINQHVRSNWGLGVLPRDTSTCPGWDRTGNPPTARRQLLPPEPYCPTTSPYFLYNIRRIRSFLTTYSTQLVRSRLDYCNSLLAGLPASAIRLLQLIRNSAARLIFNVPRYTHTTPLLTDLRWLPVIACIKFKTLVLAYQAVKGSAPAYIEQLIIPYTPARPLRSATSGCLAPPARHTCTSRSRLLSVLASRWWNDLPVDVGTAVTLTTFKRRLKTHLFRLNLFLPPS